MQIKWERMGRRGIQIPREIVSHPDPLSLADCGRDRAHGGDDIAAAGDALGEAAAAEGGADQALQPPPAPQRRDVQRRTRAQASEVSYIILLDILSIFSA